jgi:beta-N-acetylhexosaminidase
MMRRTRREPVALVAWALMVSVVLSGCESPNTPEPVDNTVVVESVAPPSESPVTPEVATLEKPRGEEVAAYLSGLTLEEKVAGLFVVFHPGNDLDVFEEFYGRLPVSGFLLLRSNLPGPLPDDAEFVASLSTMSELPLLLAVDQEGPPITRIRPDDLPGHRELGQGDPTETRGVFAARNQLVAAVGANVNFGIVADVSSGPDSYIDNRTFGSDAKKVAAHVFHAVGGRAPGVAQTLKHFPGHGMTTDDSHVVIPRVSMDLDDWLLNHGRPFRVGIGQGVELVMMSHLVVSNVDDQPASLSPFWVSYLRDEWGFDGVIVTDDVAMLQASGEEEFADPVENVMRALNAGVDLIVHSDFGPPNQELSRYDELIPAVIERVQAGEVSVDTIDEALTRVITLRLFLAGMGGGF